MIECSGHILVTIDTPYDVDIGVFRRLSSPLYPMVVINATLATIDLAVSVRGQDASFMLNQLANTIFIAKLIPGSKTGLEVKNVVMFGHSLGGAPAAAEMPNDKRFVGGLSIDGAL